MPLLNFGVLPRAPYERLPESAADDLTDSEDESVVGDLDESGRPQKRKKRLWSYIPLFSALHFQSLVLPTLTE